MKLRFGLAFAGLMLAIATPAAADQNWNTTYAATAQGFRVGNPDAPVQLIEFVSYSCPHCANFEAEADGALRAGFIHEGRVSVEVRHVIRNPIDLAAALATECGDEAGFFRRHRAMLRSHDQWMATARAASQGQMQRWTSGSQGSRMRAIAADLDFYELLEPLGVSIVALDRCLTDDARAEAIANASVANSAEFAVPGTPSFVVNGRLLEGVHTWPSLQSALIAAEN